MYKAILIPSAALAAMVLSACSTCSACGGTGLQARAESGLAPYVEGSVAHKSVYMAPCLPCMGTGSRPFGIKTYPVSDAQYCAGSLPPATQN